MSDNYVWQPVDEGRILIHDTASIDQYDTLTPDGTATYLEIDNSVDPPAGVRLPDDLRLCRRVPSGAGVPAQEADASEQLLPCPFCGSAPRVGYVPAYDILRGPGEGIHVQESFYVTCDACDCQRPSSRYPSHTEAEAIAAWNRRVPVDSLPQQEADRE